MRRIATIILTFLLVFVGCRTSPRSQDLYQSYISSVGTEAVVLRNLDQGKPLRAHQAATMELTFRLNDLHRLANTADKEQFESAVKIAHIILKNACEHRDQLIQDEYSLQMIIECKRLVTDAQDIQRASALAEYLASSSTNQIVYPEQ